MNLRYTILLACLAAVLFGLLFFLKPYIGNTKDRERMGDRITNFEIEDVTGMTIKQGDGEVRFKKIPEGWLIEDETNPDRASTQAVEKILTLAQDLTFFDVIRGAEFDANFYSRDFGLSNPRQFLEIDFKDREPLKLLFGRDAPEENHIFVRRGDSKDTFLVRDELLQAIGFPIVAYRDRRLASLSGMIVNRIQIQSSAGEVILERDSGRWKITRPLSAEADQKRIDDALEKFIAAPVLEFVGSEDQWSQAINTGSIPSSEVRLWSEGEEEPAVFRLLPTAELKGVKIPDYLVYSVPRKSALRVPGDALALSRISLNQLRNPRVFNLNPDVIDRIGFRIGDQQIRLHRTEEGWDSMQGNLDPQVTEKAVKDLIEGLHEAHVYRFLSLDHTAGEDMGLKDAVAEIRFNAWLSENTAETAAGEYPVSDLLFAQGKTGAWYVRVDKRPEVCEISEKTFELVKHFAESLGLKTSGNQPLSESESESSIKSEAKK
ncbi:MAG: DUF4340 domain-containing protein [Chthoniobacterales bacterium]